MIKTACSLSLVAGLLLVACEDRNYDQDPPIILDDGGSGRDGRRAPDRGQAVDGPHAERPDYPDTDGGVDGRPGGEGGVADSSGDGGPRGDGGNPGCNSRCAVVFEFPESGETDVRLMGEFDNWSQGQAMVNSGGKWTTTLTLDHGQLVQYKFAKNNKSEWVTDPAGPTCAEIGDNRNAYKVVECANPCPVTEDWRDGVLYFAMLDRFKNGDSQNDSPVGDRFGRQVRPIADWMGGDIQGLLDKVQDGYFNRLGVSILWISNPIAAADGAWDGSQNEIYTGYHGYWPTDMNAVEPRLGTRQQLKALIEAAHAKGIKVIMDYPMNHLHQDSPHFKAHPEWFWDYQFNGQDCKCGSEAAGCGWESAQKERCWFDPFLPDFNYGNAAALSFSLDNLVSWAKDVGGDGSGVGFDGFRMDAVKHIDMAWVTSMRQRLDSEFPGRFIWTVGETFTGSKGLIKAYIGADKLHGQFDFPLHDVIRGVIIQRGGSIKDLGGFLQDNRCPYGNGALMSTFMGNHDKQRVVHDAVNQWFGSFDFPAQPSGDAAYERLALGFTLLMTLPGVPLIYYGDEVGLAGGTDPDNRRMMPWSGKSYAEAGNDDAKTLSISAAQATLLARIKMLSAIRKAHPVLRRAYPEIDWKATTDQVLVYQMKLGRERLIVAINRSDDTQSAIDLGVNAAHDLLAGKIVDGHALSLPPRSAAILE